MSWFGFGKKAKPKPEELYKTKLDQLQKLGYSDRAKNLQLLKLYAGDVNHVIQDYQIQQPSSKSISPKQEVKKKAPPKKEEPKPAPKKKEPKKEEPKKVEPKPKTKPKPTPAQKQESKPAPAKPAQSKPKEEPKSKPQPQAQPKSEPKPESKEESKSNDNKNTSSTQSQKPKIPKGAKMVAPELVGTSKQAPKKDSKPITLKFNLRGLPSSDIRQILLNIGEPTIGEIVFSNGIDGEQFYHYIVVNPLLEKFKVNFGDEPGYSSLVKQVELSYEKNGAIVPKNKLKPISDDKKGDDTLIEKKSNDKESYEALKSNIENLISSDVRLLILPYNLELAERLYAFSIGGSDLCKFDYDGVVFATGIKNLSKDNWNKIVTELKLPQSQPFDPKQWQQLKKEQESVINQAKSLDKQIKDVKQQIAKSKSGNNQNQNQLLQNNKKQNSQKQESSKMKQLEKQQNKQLQRIVQMEKETDKYLPSQLLKLKQRQVNTLQKLHDIASIVNLDSKIVKGIKESARKQSEKQLDIYLKSGQMVIPYSQNNSDENITPQQLENRQLQLLSTINRTRAKLEKLAQSKGVSLESLTGITSNLSLSDNNKNVKITAENLDVLNAQFDNLFQSLAGIASAIPDAAKKYQTDINQDEINKFLAPNFQDLERRQIQQIAKLNYLNDQARMINPKALDINE